MQNREPRGYVQGLGRRSRQVAMFLAAATVPRTFQPTLMPRSNLDQGIITGTATVANYALANAIHDAIEGLAERAIGGRAGRYGARLRRFTGTGNLAAIALGLGLQSAFREREAEHMSRSAMRLLGYFVTTAGYGGVAVVTQQEILAALDRWTGQRYNLTSLPLTIPVGAALSSVLELRRRRSAVADRGQSSDEAVESSISRSLMMGSLVAGGLIAIASGERLLAIAIERGTQRILPGYENAARPIGHVLSLGTLVAGVYAGLQYVYGNVERSAGQLEAGFDQPPASPFVSAGPGSGVTFDSLTQYPRRHVVTYLRREWIEQAMGDSAKADPIRIYVGLDSAPTPAERVQLALAELDRTGAFDRPLLMLMSPTGTGWINPSVVQAVELYTRGDVASVALQYSKRPSPLSIGRIAIGRTQNRMLFLAIHQRLYERPPERRPRVVLYGESLGAHTSQDVFIHEGTTGLRVLGIDAALWLGTPYGSEWKSEVLGVERPDVDRSLIGVFDNFEQFERLSAEQRSALRYVLLSHENDGVTYFGLDVLVRRPDWLGPNRPAVVPPESRWLPIPSFLQSAVDMKNAQNVIPGKFQAYGHDYRSDIARFVNAAYGLDATEQEIERVEQALRRYELAVDRWAKEGKQPATRPDSPAPAMVERGA